MDILEFLKIDGEHVKSGGCRKILPTN